MLWIRVAVIANSALYRCSDSASVCWDELQSLFVLTAWHLGKNTSERSRHSSRQRLYSVVDFYAMELRKTYRAISIAQRTSLLVHLLRLHGKKSRWASMMHDMLSGFSLWPTRQSDHPRANLSHYQSYCNDYDDGKVCTACIPWPTVPSYM